MHAYSLNQAYKQTQQAKANIAKSASQKLPLPSRSITSDPAFLHPINLPENTSSALLFEKNPPGRPNFDPFIPLRRSQNTAHNTLVLLLNLHPTFPFKISYHFFAILLIVSFIPRSRSCIWSTSLIFSAGASLQAKTSL